MHIATIGQYLIDLQTGNVVNSGYRVYKMSWQSHREGLPIKRKIRQPRFKLISTCLTEQIARDTISNLIAGNNDIR